MQTCFQSYKSSGMIYDMEQDLDEVRRRRIAMGHRLIYKILCLTIAFIFLEVKIDFSLGALRPISLLFMVAASMPESYLEAEKLFLQTRAALQPLLFLALVVMAVPACVVLALWSPIKTFSEHRRLGACEEKLLQSGKHKN